MSALTEHSKRLISQLKDALEVNGWRANVPGIWVSHQFDNGNAELAINYAPDNNDVYNLALTLDDSKGHETQLVFKFVDYREKLIDVLEFLMAQKQTLTPDTWDEFVAKLISKFPNVRHNDDDKNKTTLVKADPKINGPVCSQCGSNEYVVPISYGLHDGPVVKPASETQDQEYRAGDWIGNERWHCNRCDRSFIGD